MNCRSLAVAIALIILAGPAVAQEKLQDFVVQVEAVTPEQAGALCEDGLSRAETANAFDLLLASTACRRVGRADDTAFLTLVGQARAMADISVLTPATEEAKDGAGSLYGLIFFYFGGPGDNEVYRDPRRAAAVLARHAAWKASFGPGYDPGWARTGSVSGEAYASKIGEAKTHRIAQLDSYIILQADPAFRAASDEMDAISKRNPTGIMGGTPDNARAEELMAIMDDRGKALGLDR